MSMSMTGESVLSSNQAAVRCRVWIRRWLQSRQRLSQRAQPDWNHLPDRLWRRNSALLVLLHDRQPGGAR